MAAHDLGELRGKAAGLIMREAVTEVERDWERRLGSKRMELLKELLRELSGHAEA